MEKLYIVSQNNTRSWLWLRSWTPFIVKFRLKWKKVGKTTRSFRYDINQILYNSTVEVTNRFKRLDLIDRLPEELWMEVHDIVQEAGINCPQEKEMQKGKMVVWGGLINSYGKKKSKKQRRKGKIYSFECRVPKKSMRDKKAFLSDQCKEIEENNRMGKTRDLFQENQRYQGTISCKDGHNKGQK